MGKRQAKLHFLVRATERLGAVAEQGFHHGKIRPRGRNARIADSLARCLGAILQQGADGFPLASRRPHRRFVQIPRTARRRGRFAAHQGDVAPDSNGQLLGRRFLRQITTGEKPVENLELLEFCSGAAKRVRAAKRRLSLTVTTSGQQQTDSLFEVFRVGRLNPFGVLQGLQSHRPWRRCTIAIASGGSAKFGASFLAHAKSVGAPA